MSRPLWLEPAENPQGHDDIVLTLGTAAHREDSYYFAVDPAVAGDQPDRTAIAAAVAQLLRNWLERLNANSTWLPAGFSDQSTTWLQCVRNGSQVTLTCGWSEDEGWAVPPSNPADVTPTQFTPFDHLQPLELYRPRLLSLIRSNIAHLVKT